ncbi:hypothetical protein BMS3Bbin14_02076 [bacterium BMS3Bbin14]|nr:hypothetical protein BMS3Bbin14_02076 [bacterium BMS3Bbin14]
MYSIADVYFFIVQQSLHIRKSESGFSPRMQKIPGVDGDRLIRYSIIKNCHCRLGRGTKPNRFRFRSPVCWVSFLYPTYDITILRYHGRLWCYVARYDEHLSDGDRLIRYSIIKNCHCRLGRGTKPNRFRFRSPVCWVSFLYPTYDITILRYHGRLWCYVARYDEHLSDGDRLIRYSIIKNCHCRLGRGTKPNRFRFRSPVCWVSFLYPTYDITILRYHGRLW